MLWWREGSSPRRCRCPSTKEECVPSSSASSERVLQAIKDFDSCFKEVSSGQNGDYYILSDSEGKYFNVYAWLRVRGLIKRYDFKNPIYVYLNLEGLKSGKIEFSNDSPAEGFNGPKENIYKPHEDASQSGKWFRIPKLELTEDYKAKTLCHIGDFVDRGRNSLSCLLTIIYLKQQLINKGKSECLKLLLGKNEFTVDDNELECYDGLLCGVTGKEVKENIIVELCRVAVRQDYFVFVDVIDVGGEKVLLEHATCICDLFMSLHVCFPDKNYRYITVLDDC